MKNPYGVEPTRFLKRNESDCAIECDPRYGPIFGYGRDICIRDNCNKNGGWTCYGNEDELMNEMKMIGIELTKKEKEEIRGCFYQPLFVNISQIIDNNEYDKYLREWVGNDCKWKLIYRASEHEYTAKSFHKYCDNKGPTLMVVKSSGGWIFGGYTTQSWSGDGIYYDMMIINR